MAQSPGNTKRRSPEIEYKLCPEPITVIEAYRCKMATFLSLRCVLENQEDAWIALNVDGADIILHQGEDTYIIQLVHDNHLKTKPILKEEFLAPKGDFSFLNYSQNMVKLKQSIDANSQKSEISKCLQTLDNAHFVFFTNRKSKVFDFLQQSCNGDMLRYLNTKDNTNVFKFKLAQLSSALHLSNMLSYRNFYLLPNQSNVKEIDKKILKELEKIAKKFNLLQTNIKNICDAFSKYITNWKNGISDENCRLTKQNITSKLTELLLSKYEINLSGEKFHLHNSEKTHLWGEIVHDKSVTVIDSNENISTFLIEYIESHVRKYYKNSADSWMDQLSVQHENLLYQKHEGLEAHLNNISKNHDQITFLDIYKYLWMHNHLPLLVEVKTMHDYNDVLHILKLSNYVWKIIIVNKSGEHLRVPNIDESIKSFYSLQDLNEEHRNKILKQQVKLQGRAFAVLGNLVNESMFQYIKCRDVVNILLNNFNIGDNLKPLPEYFNKRGISRIFIKSEILDQVQNEIFLIEENSENSFDLLSIQNCNVDKLEDLNFRNLNECCIIINSESFTAEQIRKVRSFTDNPIHHLSIHDAKHLEWKTSFGSVEEIREFQVKLDDAAERDLMKFSSNITIVSAAAGMGKSVLIDYVAHQIATNQWVLRIDLNAHEQYYESFKYIILKEKAAKHLEYFKNASVIQNGNDADLANKVFQKLMQTGNLVVLLDGFDEVSSASREEVISILRSLHNEGYCLWITTRPHMNFDLEEEFNILAHTFKPLSINEQKKLLIKYFKNFTNTDLVSKPNAVIDDFIEKLLQVSKRNLTGRDAKIIGTPLQLKILANVFSEDFKKLLFSQKTINFYKNFNLLSLYQNFVNKENNSNNSFSPQDERCRSVCALKLLFPSKSQQLHNLYENEKNLKDGVVKFGHRSIAEFLAAQWLSENLNSSNEKIKEIVKILIKERFTKGYEFLFNIFDRLIAKNCPVHLAIINQQIDVAIGIIRSDPNVMYIADEGGRTILHIIALYGTQYPPLFKMMEPFQNYAAQTFINSAQFNFDPVLKVIEKIPNDKSLHLLKDLLGYNSLDYALANRSLTIANKILAKKRNRSIKINVEIPFVMKRDYLGYCALLNYRKLLNTLLPYFASRDLLLRKVYLHLPVHTYLRSLFKHHLDCENILKYEIKYIEKTVLNLLTSKKACIYSGWVDNYYTDLRYAVCFGSIENVSARLIRETDINKRDSGQNTLLHYAVYHARPRIVEMLLLKGAKVDAGNAIDNTPLHEAVKYSDTKNERKVRCVKLLIFNGTNVNAPNKFGRSAFHIASSLGDTDILNLFLSERVDVNKQDNDGRTPLFYATWNNRLDAVKLLIASGADVNSESTDGWTALHHAIFYAFNAVATEIISKDININKQNNDGDTALFLAVREKEIDAVKLLISNGANINLQNKKGETVCGVAARRGYNDILTIMIPEGADIEKLDNCGLTPFLGAVASYQLDTVKLLISKGANINAERNDGRTALHLTCYSGDNDILVELLSRGADIDKQDNNGKTGLFYAIHGNQIVTAKLLIDIGANINIQDKNGRTVLHYSAYLNHIQIVPEILLKCDDIDKQDNNGETAVFGAVLNNNKDMVKLLISNGAKVNVENKQTASVLHAAALGGNNDILSEILSRTVDVNKQTIHGNTPLFYAVRQNNANSVNLLISNGSQVNIENKSGRTVLHLAAEGGYDIIIGKILSKTVNINKQDQDGNTPLFYAVQKNKLNTVKLLISSGANINTKNKKGETVSHIARKNNYGDILNHILLNWVSMPIFKNTQN